MSKARRPIAQILCLLVFMLSHCFATGCNDPSRTTGTMVEESEEAKAYRQKKMETMKRPNLTKKGKTAKRKVSMRDNRRILYHGGQDLTELADPMVLASSLDGVHTHGET